MRSSPPDWLPCSHGDDDARKFARLPLPLAPSNVLEGAFACAPSIRAATSDMPLPTGTADLGAFESSDASHIADELTAALEPGIQMLRPLGAGAMGLVFLGRDPLLKRLVAIKVLSPHLAGDDVARGRFVRESEASAAVSHPNVAGIYVVGELPASKTPYFVMRFIEGRSLADDVAGGGAMSEMRAKRLIGEIASALAAAHARGLVHRDVKPANIMIENETDRPFVLDFGISAVLQRDETPGNAKLTSAGTYVGTPTYMSPEQATGEEVTGKSDVYALGLIAFELLSGKPPFDGPPVVVMAAHVEKAPPSLHVMRPGIDDHLAELVERCLRKNPADRPSAADVAHALVPSARSVIEWPPPGLEELRGKAARLVWRWVAACVVTLAFFLFLHVQPTLGSPRWAQGEQSTFWSGVMTPDAMLDDTAERRGTDVVPSAADATQVWMFLVSGTFVLLMLIVVFAISHTSRLTSAMRRAVRDGYPGAVAFDVAWDRYADTGLLLNGGGAYALLTPEQRERIVHMRRRYAIAGVAMVALSVLAPLLWLTGALRVRGTSAEIVAPWELLFIALPLLVGLIALVALDRRTRLGTGARRRSRVASNPMQRELVTAWLNVAGRAARAPSSFAKRAVMRLASAVTTVALFVLAYVVAIVFVVVFFTTTRLATGRAKAEQWRASFLVDSTRPMRLVELDTLAKRLGIATQGTQPDMDAARLLVSRAYAWTDAKKPPPALVVDVAGARALTRGLEEDGPTPTDVYAFLGDSMPPSAESVRKAEPYARTPWLDIWRRFAASPEYPMMWQYRAGLPGTRYLPGLPILPYGSIKDMAYRNSIAGLIALEKGDVTTATLRGRENIAAGRKFLSGSSLLDNLVGLVIIGIGRGELQVVAKTTGDRALREEMAKLRVQGIRWRGERIPSVGMMAMVADPESREAIRYTKQLASPSHFGELMFITTAGFCMNARELLVGSDTARSALLHDVAMSSGNPRASELEVLGNNWLTDTRDGTMNLSELGLPRVRLSPFAPLGWMGMRGFKDRAFLCLSGLLAN